VRSEKGNAHWGDMLDSPPHNSVTQLPVRGAHPFTPSVPCSSLLPGGLNVLHMDGHVRFMTWPGSEGPGGSWRNPETEQDLPVGTTFPASAASLILHEGTHYFGDIY